MRLGNQRSREQDAAPPSAGKLAQAAIRGQRQAGNDHLDFLLEPPAIPFFELVLKTAETFQVGCITAR